MKAWGWSSLEDEFREYQMKFEAYMAMNALALIGSVGIIVIWCVMKMKMGYGGKPGLIWFILHAAIAAFAFGAFIAAIANDEIATLALLIPVVQLIVNAYTTFFAFVATKQTIGEEGKTVVQVIQN
jgi:hypothetical protein